MSGSFEESIFRIIVVQIFVIYYCFKNDFERMLEFCYKLFEDCIIIGNKEFFIIFNICIFESIGNEMM